MANITLLAPAGVSQVSAPGGPYYPASDGTISVPTTLISEMLKAGCTFISTNADCCVFVAPIAAELVSIVAAATPVSGTPMTIAAQPAYPVKLQVRNVMSGAVAGLSVTIVGVDARGNAVTEIVNVAGASSATFNTVNAYAKVTSVTPNGTVTNVTTLGVGVGTALGLPLPPTFVDLVVYKEGVAATGSAAPADEAVGTVDTVAGTVAPTTVANGTKVFWFWYSWTTAA